MGRPRGEDGNIITAAGGMAWFDLGRPLINRFLGTAIERETARIFLIGSGARERQAHDGFVPRLDHGDVALLKVQHWLQASCTDKITLSMMASRDGATARD